jgi:tetratricopeptide (TPR) repeat protein
LHDQAAALDRIEKRPSLESIMGLGFWGRSSSRAYTAAGSFTLWLRETRGPESVAQLYGNAGDFESTYGESLEALERQWLEFLRARPMRDEDVASIAQRYKRRSVFRRPCAHRAAELAKEATRARKEGRLEEALSETELLCTLEPDDPAHRLTLARVHAESAAYDEAMDALDEAEELEDLSDTVLARIDESRGDVAMVAERYEVAASHYDRGLDRGVGENTQRILQLKRIAARDPELAPMMVRYFAPFESTRDGSELALRRVYIATRIAALPRHASIGNYLAAVQLRNVGEFAAARERLMAALHPEPGVPQLPTPEILRAARLVLLNVETREGRFDEARTSLDALEADPDIGNGHRMEHEMWRARIDFFERRQALQAPGELRNPSD